MNTEMKEFAMYLTGHSEKTILQLYRSWLCKDLKPEDKFAFIENRSKNILNEMREKVSKMMDELDELDKLDEKIS